MGSVIVEVSGYKESPEVRVWRIVAIEGIIAMAELIPADNTEQLKGAIDAAKEKFRCYHCKGPHFIKTENKWDPCGKSRLAEQMW